MNNIRPAKFNLGEDGTSFKTIKTPTLWEGDYHLVFNNVSIHNAD